MDTGPFHPFKLTRSSGERGSGRLDDTEQREAPQHARASSSTSTSMQETDMGASGGSAQPWTHPSKAHVSQPSASVAYETFKSSDSGRFWSQPVSDHLSTSGSTFSEYRSSLAVSGQPAALKDNAPTAVDISASYDSAQHYPVEQHVLKAKTATEKAWDDRVGIAQHYPAEQHVLKAKTATEEAWDDRVGIAQHYPAEQHVLKAKTATEKAWDDRVGIAQHYPAEQHVLKAKTATEEAWDDRVGIAPSTEDELPIRSRKMVETGRPTTDSVSADIGRSRYHTGWIPVHKDRGGFGSSLPYRHEPHTQPTHTPRKRRPLREEDFVYNMSHARRGQAVIFNNMNFLPKTKVSHREGSDLDARTLTDCLSLLDFEVRVFNDMTRSGMLSTLKNCALTDHSDADCFVCVVLSHGDTGLVYATDGPVGVGELARHVNDEACPTLSGKPRLFFIQACRGYRLDEGVVVPDGWEKSDGRGRARHPVLSMSDFLFAYSSADGYFSWRNATTGSWFVQALTQVLGDHGNTREIVWILTRVTNMVAMNFESRTLEPFLRNKKQIPTFVTMLTKHLYFTPKLRYS